MRLGDGGIGKKTRGCSRTLRRENQSGRNRAVADCVKRQDIRGIPVTKKSGGARAVGDPMSNWPSTPRTPRAHIYPRACNARASISADCELLTDPRLPEPRRYSRRTCCFDVIIVARRYAISSAVRICRSARSRTSIPFKRMESRLDDNRARGRGDEF